MLTDFGALTTSKKKLWSAFVLSEGRDASFWMGNQGLMGSGTRDATKPVHLITELTKTTKGTKCVMPLVSDLTSDGIVDDNDLEGQEEAMVNDDVEISISQLRHAVKSRGALSEQETVITFRATAKDKLAFWLGDKTDEVLFLVGSGVALTSKVDGSSRSATSQLPSLAFASDITAPSTNRKIFAGSATSTGTLTANDKMSWDLLLGAQAKAKRKRLKPVRVAGKETYVVVMSPEQGRDLRQSADYKAAVAQGGDRGKTNALFTGAFASVDGLVLYEHNKVYNTLGTATKWGAGNAIDGAQALLLGAQALGFARVGDASWGESDNQDYGNRQGISYGTMIGAIKPVFRSTVDGGTSEDFSLMSIYTAASSLAAA